MIYRTKPCEMLFNGTFPQFCNICKLFDYSVLFQFLPAVLKPARFEILDRRFERRNFLPLSICGTLNIDASSITSRFALSGLSWNP